MPAAWGAGAALNVVVAGALAAGAGCAVEEPSCGLARVRDDGWVPVADPNETPFVVGEIRQAMCVRGIVPCGPDAEMPVSTDERVLRVFRDATLPWVFHLAGVATGRAEVRQACPEGGESAYGVEVR